MGVHRPARERERDALGGRPLRLPRRGDRRAADARRRVRSRHRAADPRAGGRGCRDRRGAARSTCSSRSSRTRRASASPVGSPSFARAASRATPTTPDARSRVSSRRPAEAERRRSSSSAPTLPRFGVPASADESRRPRRASRKTVAMSWRDVMCGDPRPEHVGRVADALRVGRHATGSRRARLRRPPRPHGRDAARDQPGAVADRGRAREGDPQRVRSPFAGRGRRTLGGDDERGDGDGRRRAPGGRARDRLALDAAPLPARRGGRGREPAPSLPLAGSAHDAHAAQHAPVAHRHLVDPPDHGRPRIHRRLDAEHDARDAGGSPRLPRARAPAAGSVLRARAVAADLQAALHDRRARPLLPDRDLLAGRGSSRRPAVRVPAARPRAGVRRARERARRPRAGRRRRVRGARSARHRHGRSRASPTRTRSPATAPTSPTFASASRSRTRPR